MYGQSGRVSLWWQLACCGAVLVVAGILGGSFAAAAEPPSLDEIKTRLKRQHSKIDSKMESLYLKTKTELKSPFSAEELLAISDLWGARYPRYGLVTREIHWAFKGRKRYWRFIDSDDDLTTAPPVPPLPDDATPLEISWHKRIVQQREYFEQRDLGGRVRTGTDVAKISNGKVSWLTSAHEYVHPDGRIEQDRPHFRRRAQLWVPVSIYLRRLGWSLLGLKLTTPEYQNAAPQHALNASLPELLERRSYSVSKVTEVIDGAECVVLTGVLERPLLQDSLEDDRNDKLWLDLDHGLALRKREWSTGAGRALFRQVTSDWHEFASEFWLPRQIEVQTLIPLEATRYAKKFRGRVVLSRRTTLIECAVNQVADELFEMPRTDKQVNEDVFDK